MGLVLERGGLALGDEWRMFRNRIDKGREPLFVGFGEVFGVPEFAVEEGEIDGF